MTHKLLTITLSNWN